MLADCGNRAKLRQVFERYRPEVVFHAAAYKHVPLMEANPIESVRNNVLATRAVADVAVEFGADRFVLVSTDKAANPKTVMGQSKALCEWVVETHGRRTDVPTRFVAVRFGNVLGSSGRVVPIFRRQIERGGPLTVTHPEMTRYFMTIPEAASLVVQAGAIGGRGEVYVLDMGEPVKIVELAENMIRLSGPDRRPDRVRRHPPRREAPRGALERRARPSTRRRTPKISRGDPRADRRGLARRGAERAPAARGRGRHARAGLAARDDRAGACSRFGTDSFHPRHDRRNAPARLRPARSLRLDVPWTPTPFSAR